MSKVIEFSDVSFSYDEENIIDHYSLTINKGEFICLTGESGCGKTTLLRMINGLNNAKSGTIEVLNKEMKDWDGNVLRRRMGYIVQEGGLFPHLSVYQNMCYAMKLSEYTPSQCEQRINDLIPIVNLNTNLLHKFPNELSGGQRQRVGIVRGIAHKPDIVLMDEPFSALDPENRTKLQSLVADIHKSTATTFVMVTHNMDEAERLATRIIEMKKQVFLSD